MKYEIKIYETCPENLSRFALGTIGKKTLFAIGVNPSTADEQIPDATIKKIMGFAMRAGFDSFVMLNLYAQRTTYPKNLHSILDKSINKKNLEVIESVISLSNNITILACWGNNISRRPFLVNCLNDIYSRIKRHNIRWLKIGELTIMNNPRHPSRPGYDCELTTFNIEKYLKNKIY